VQTAKKKWCLVGNFSKKHVVMNLHSTLSIFLAQITFEAPVKGTEFSFGRGKTVKKRSPTKFSR
jgi:hypothetical protein